MLKSSSKEKYPLFTFVKGHSKDYDFASSPLHEEKHLFPEDEKKRLKKIQHRGVCLALRTFYTRLLAAVLESTCFLGNPRCLCPPSPERQACAEMGLFS